MKKLFSSLFILLAVVVCQAQISISGTNIMPTGTMLIQNRVAESNYGRIPVATGANQTWDWSQLADTLGADTTESVTIQTSPYAAYFPNANRAIKTRVNLAGNMIDFFVHYNFSPQAVSVVGYRTQFSMTQGGTLFQSTSANRQLSPNQPSRFPEQYQNDYTFPYNEIDSSRTRISVGNFVVSDDIKYETRTGTVRVEVVGWGNLILRRGTIPALLKRTTETYKIREYEFDTQLGQFVKTDSSDRVDVRLSWVSNDAAYEVAVVNYDPNSTTISGAHYFNQAGTTSLNRTLVAESAMALYPVPAKDVLHIKLDQPVGNGMIILQDLTGRTVATAPVDGLVGQLTLDGLVSGPYIARVQDSNGNFTAAKRITVIK